MTSQDFPAKPEGQVHLYPLRSLLQFPEFLHGLVALPLQKSFCSHLLPKNPEGHAQLKVPFIAVHVELFPQGEDRQGS